ncbi:flagellar basal body-associated protein FliL [Massilia endophytica]|uniref:flagellar basal body-associated protein FliL n=1 Tax=Massilia endophytica TaxID=2899220 RepID=UPI001E3CD407|nr:flagellar basal body-associated protein FliL [Massilia endophytica]UGQ45216.1 flagellar basal body-associated protein FliL [Massilia endophytica]
MKANPKAKAEAKPEAAAPVAGSKKKLLIMIGAAVLVLGLAGGGAAWYFLHKSGDQTEESAPKKEVAPPEYVAIEPFTVNLQPEDGEQYLQLAFTLQVGGLEQVELIKKNMPKVRSRILLLLSSKHASEINTPEGKQQLSTEIMQTLKQPFTAGEPEQDVSEVLFTSFIIQ